MRFVGSLVDHFATERDVLAVHRKEDDVDSMLLLTRQRGIWRTFLPSQTQIPPVLLSDDLAVDTLLRTLPPTAFAIDLLCQDPEYSVADALHTRRSHQAAPHATTLNIAVSGTFEEYWEARSRGLRQQVRRAQRKAEGDGLVPRLEILSDAQAIENGLDRYGVMESSGWKAREGTAVHPGNVQGRFYKDMLMRFAAHGRAMIFELHLGDRLAASQLTLGNDYMLITLKTTHDESLKAYSPGTLLDYFMLEHEFARRRYQVVEYYTNASVELLRWGTAQRVISHHRLYRFSCLVPVATRFSALRSWLARRSPTNAAGRQAHEDAPSGAGKPDRV